MTQTTESSTTFLLWSFIERGVQIAVAVIVGAATARYLGPSRFGALSALWSLAALCWPLAQIGYPLVVRDLVRNPADAPEILGTITALNAAGAAVALALYAGAGILLLDHTEPTPWLVAAIFGISIASQPVAVADLWFQAHRETRTATLARSLGTLTSGGLRVLVIVTGGGLVAIALTMAGDVVLPAVLVLVALWWRRGVSPRTWSFSFARCRLTWARALPLLIAGISVAIYMRIDQVMIEALSTSRQAGLYAAAVRISEASYFLPLALLRVATPVLLRLRDSNRNDYENRLMELLSRLATAAIVASVVLIVAAEFLTETLFGADYGSAASVLRIHALSTVFVFLGVGQSIWTVTEELETTAMRRSLLGAGVNVALNLVLIPRLGASGAAWGTLCAYFVATVGANAVVPKTRPLLAIQLRALSPAVQARVLADDVRRIMGRR